MRDLPRLQQRRADPDPIVIDLLVNLTATAFAGLLVKIGKSLAGSRRRRDRVSHRPNENALVVLEGNLENLERSVEHAAQPVTPSSRRKLGGQILLEPVQIREYHEVRDTLLRQLGTIDELAETLLPDLDQSGLGEGGSQGRLPREFKTQVTFVEKRLRDARVATLAEGAFLEIKSSVVAMKGMLDQLRRMSGQR